MSVSGPSYLYIYTVDDDYMGGKVCGKNGRQWCLHIAYRVSISIFHTFMLQEFYPVYLNRLNRCEVVVIVVGGGEGTVGGSWPPCPYPLKPNLQHCNSNLTIFIVASIMIHHKKCKF